MPKQWAVIDTSGEVISWHKTRDEAEAKEEALNGPIYPGVDAQYDFKRLEQRLEQEA